MIATAWSVILLSPPSAIGRRHGDVIDIVLVIVGRILEVGRRFEADIARIRVDSKQRRIRSGQAVGQRIAFRIARHRGIDHALRAQVFRHAGTIERGEDRGLVFIRHRDGNRVVGTVAVGTVAAMPDDRGICAPTRLRHNRRAGNAL